LEEELVLQVHQQVVQEQLTQVVEVEEEMFVLHQVQAALVS